MALDELRVLVPPVYIKFRNWEREKHKDKSKKMKTLSGVTDKAWKGHVSETEKEV
jgi:hypothetical protein